jgi:hypothetical protein
VSSRYARCKGGRDRIRAGVGGPCKRCGEPLQKWQHTAGWQPEPGAGYYEYWFLCVNGACKVRQVMPKEAWREPKLPFHFTPKRHRGRKM